jgi:hypothetical protein
MNETRTKWIPNAVVDFPRVGRGHGSPDFGEEQKRKRWQKNAEAQQRQY